MEESRVDNSTKWAILGDEKQYTCNHEHCRQIYNSKVELDEHLVDAHDEMYGFEILDYQDPLGSATDLSASEIGCPTYDSSRLLRIVSRNSNSSIEGDRRSNCQTRGMQGLINNLQEMNLESEEEDASENDIECVSLSESAQEIMDVPLENLHPSKISKDTSEKIYNSIHGSVIGFVRDINSYTVDQYCDIVRKSYPVDEEDWPSLSDDISDAARKGPKINIKCARGKITGYKKKDNIKIVAFIKHPNVNYEYKNEEIEGIVKDYIDDDVDFNFNGTLPLSGFSNSVLRVEIRKIQTKNMNSRFLVGFTEIPVREIASNPAESYYELQQDDKKPRRISLINNVESQGHIVLTLHKDDSQEDPNSSVPMIFKNYFWSKALEYFNIIEDDDAKTTDDMSFDISVEQNVNLDKKGNKMFYQKVLTVDGNSLLDDNESSMFVLDCILTNKLELGVGARNQRSQSSLNLTVPPTTGRKSSLSGLSGSTNSRKGSITSLLSIDEAPRKISNILNNTMESLSPSNGFLNKTLNTLSPTVKPKVKSVPVERLISSLHLHKTVNHTLDDEDSISWNTKIESTSSQSINETDLRKIYINAIFFSLNVVTNPADWSGVFSNTLKSVLNFSLSFVSGKKKEIKLCLSSAFLEAHTIFPFNEVILKKHIENIVQEDPESETLKNHTKYCLDIVTDHRNETKKHQLPAVLQTLSLLSNGTTVIGEQIRENVKNCAKTLFAEWESEAIEKTVKAKKNNSKEELNYMEVCRDILNKHVHTDITITYKQYQELFESFDIDYKFEIWCQYILLSKDLLERYPSPQEKKLLLKYNANDPRVKSLQVAYECFSAFRRVFKLQNEHERCPPWLYDSFEQYPGLWMDMAIYKAEDQVNNLLKLLQENELQFTTKTTIKDEPDGRRLHNQDSIDDVTNSTLLSFIGIAETCWTFRKELDWPSLKVNLDTGLKLIEDFAKFEERLLNFFQRMAMKDEDYDTVELGRTIKLLDGLIRRHYTTAEEVSKLHLSIAEKEDMDEYIEDFKEKIKHCYETIESIKEKSRQEINTKIKDYCDGRRPQLKEFMLNKNLVSDLPDGNCLLKFLDDELKSLHDHVSSKYTNIVIESFWSAMEDELLANFNNKLERNLQKNKPERFNYFREALPILINLKKSLYDNEIITPKIEVRNQNSTQVQNDVGLMKLRVLYEKIMVLTETTENLVTKLLRQKVKNQKMDYDENDNKANSSSYSSIGVKTAHIGSNDKIKLEIVNLNNIKSREGRQLSNLQIYVRLFPDVNCAGEIFYKTDVFKEVGPSIIFDLQHETPVIFEIPIDHVSRKEEYEDAFITLDVFHVKHLVHWKYFIGEAVIQVKKNGLLVPEICSFDNETDLQSSAIPCLSFNLTEFPMLKQTEEFRELNERKDDLAIAVMTKEEKIRKKSVIKTFTT